MSCCESEGTRVEVVCEILLACHEGGRYIGGGSGPAAGATYLRTGPAVPGPHWLVLVPPSSGHCGPARGPASLRSSGPLERQGAWREGLEEVQGLVKSGQVHSIVISPGPGSPERKKDIGEGGGAGQLHGCPSSPHPSSSSLGNCTMGGMPAPAPATAALLRYSCLFSPLACFSARKGERVFREREREDPHSPPTSDLRNPKEREDPHSPLHLRPSARLPPARLPASPQTRGWTCQSARTCVARRRAPGCG